MFSSVNNFLFLAFYSDFLTNICTTPRGFNGSVLFLHAIIVRFSFKYWGYLYIQGDLKRVYYYLMQASIYADANKFCLNYEFQNADKITFCFLCAITHCRDNSTNTCKPYVKYSIPCKWFT